MHSLANFLHLLAAMVWLGGIVFMLFALRPAAAKVLAPPLRMPLIARTLERFFPLVWATIAVLLATGLTMLLGVGMKNSPPGWHAMLGIGLLMFALFGHLYFGPYRRLRQAVTVSDWAESGKRASQIATLALVNLLLGVAAIAAVYFLV